MGLKIEHDISSDESFIRGIPFVVPGGRFNEMYGWDSYFEALGLITDGRIELARGMVENFWYQIERNSDLIRLRQNIECKSKLLSDAVSAAIFDRHDDSNLSSFGTQTILDPRGI